MGPEPLGAAFTPGALAKALGGRKAPIKPLLLDQRIVAGLGNIYVCEALHRAHIAPTRGGGSLTPIETRRLVKAIRAVLIEAIEAGGSSLREFAAPGGYFAHRFRVYDRGGSECPCGGEIVRSVQAGRATYACPRCQT